MAESRRELPHLIHSGLDEEAFVKAVQENFDAIGGMEAALAANLKTLADDVASAGEPPVITGEDIPPGTFPSPPSDGLAPLASPGAGLTGGPRWLAVKWSGVANADPVTYEIHVSTSSGFTPSASTLAAETPGNLAFIRNLQDGTPLLYDTDYYVKLIAKDEDGAAPAGTQAGPERLDPNGQEDITVGSITAAHLATIILAATKIYSPIDPSLPGNEDAWRLEIGDPGFPIRYWDGSEVRFSVDNNGNVLARTANLVSAKVKDFIDFEGQAAATPTRNATYDVNGSGEESVAVSWGGTTPVDALLVAWVLAGADEAVITAETAGWTAGAEAAHVNGAGTSEYSLRAKLFYIEGAAARSGSETFKATKTTTHEGNTFAGAGAASGSDRVFATGVTGTCSVSGNKPAAGASVDVKFLGNVLGDSSSITVRIRDDLGNTIASNGPVGPPGLPLTLNFTPTTGRSYVWDFIVHAVGGDFAIVVLDKVEVKVKPRVSVIMAAYSGLVLAGATDKTATANGTGTTVSSGTTAAVAQDEELFAALLGHVDDTDADRTGSPTNSFTFVQEKESGTPGAGQVHLHTYQKAVTGGGQAAVAQDITASKKHVGLVVTFKAKQSEPAAPGASVARMFAQDKGGETVPLVKTDDSSIFDFTVPIYLGRQYRQAAAWSNAAADGYEEWGGGASASKGITVTKRRADTLLVIRCFATFIATTPGGMLGKVTEEGGSDVDAVFSTANNRGGLLFVVQSTALAEGSHTFKLMIDTVSGTTGTNTDDFLEWEVWEVATP